VPNNIGKITTKVYILYIFSFIKEDLEREGLTFCQDTNSAYTSKATLKYIQDNRIKLITLSGVSPDFSICKTIARPLKKAFYKRRYITEKAVLARFEEVFNKIDQGKVQLLYT
jgi:hypothetical protein